MAEDLVEQVVDILNTGVHAKNWHPDERAAYEEGRKLSFTVAGQAMRRVRAQRIIDLVEENLRQKALEQPIPQSPDGGVDEIRRRQALRHEERMNGVCTVCGKVRRNCTAQS